MKLKIGTFWRRRQTCTNRINISLFHLYFFEVVSLTRLPLLKYEDKIIRCTYCTPISNNHVYTTHMVLWRPTRVIYWLASTTPMCVYVYISVMHGMFPLHKLCDKGYPWPTLHASLCMSHAPTCYIVHTIVYIIHNHRIYIE